MQYKYPELLWGLLLLLIPIIIHLFQLRRFKKTPFTNVAMLQKVVSESRKSSSLKKWLLLFTRLALLACLVFAFAQPFFAKKTAISPEEMVIYVDNSFSMQARLEGQALLEKAVQDIVKNLGDTRKASVFTNDKTFKNVKSSSIKNELLSLPYTHQQLTFEQVLLKAKTLFSGTAGTENHLIVVSDFQQRFVGEHTVDSSQVQLHLVKLESEASKNVAIDSVYVNTAQNEQMELKVLISGLQEGETLPVSLLNGSRLIAKSAVEGKGRAASALEFSIPASQAIKGKVVLQDNSLGYDNSFYFNIDKRPKIKVLAIGEANSDFLSKIYTDDDFVFTKYTLNTLNYSAIENQNLVVLNELKELPKSLQDVLLDFTNNGGSLLLIPHKEGNLSTYNALLARFGRLQYQELLNFEQKISKINFEHPVFKNVFEKKVTNFDHPQVNSYYALNESGSNLLTYASGAPFLTAQGNLYLFSAPLNSDNSNFKNAPLIVPTFYRIGALSLQLPELYQTIGIPATVEIPTQLEKDNIVKLTHKTSEFIPLQQSFSNKVSLTFDNLPKQDGIFAVRNAYDTLQHISFNHSRAESVLDFPSIQHLSPKAVYNSIPKLFQDLDDSNAITDYWKWFVIFAIIFALLELLIQKTLA